MREITTELKMDSMGRVMIPKAYRDDLELKPGQLVKVVISNPYKKQEGQV
jgi:AbrB family looped-hinge helix DNA binding protein